MARPYHCFVLASMRYAGYRWLWVSNAAGNSGRWAFSMAIGWLTLQLTHSGFAVGAAVFATSGPIILVSPLAGLLADRFDRRLVLAAAFAVSALASGGIALLSLMHLLTVPALLLLATAFGIGFAVQIVAWNVIVPQLVPADELLNAISLAAIARQGSEFLGPALATPLFVVAGPAAAFGLCFVLYVLAVALTLPIPACLPLGYEGSGLLEPVVQGLRYMRGVGVVWLLIVLVGLHCTLTMSYMGLLPSFVAGTLHGGDPLYGTIMTVVGLGAILGSLALAAVTGLRRRGPWLLWTAVVSGLSLVVLGEAHDATVAIVAAFLVGSSQTMFMSVALALLQGWAKDEYRGRVTSVYNLLSGGPMALMGWGDGGLADVYPPALVLVASGLTFVALLGAIAVRSADLRRLFSRGGSSLVREPALP
jgi:MFS family permease